MPIRVLPPQQAARIAAGEVVERPASVVKELVDNALDASADSITVEIRGGGLELIRVVDDGSGISADEAPLAFQRFATSKLPPDGSLDGITTLGFRGEALPSIAAVSGVTLVTRTAGEAAGTLVELEDGETVRVSPQGSPPGTSVSVRGLFRNVPARLKFLRSATAEAGRVQTLVQHFALAFPEVRFRLEVDGRAAFSAPGRGSLRDACAAVYGARLAQSLLEADSPDEAGPEAPSVHGLISPPDVSRSTRGQISLIVNRRWVQSRALTFALEEAYQGFLMERRHPLAVLHIAVPPQDVDVNVHPAKLEVRFRREREVFSTVQRAVRGALVAQSPVPTVRGGLEPPKPFGRPPAAAAPQQAQVEQAITMFAPEGWSAQQSTPRQVVPSLRVLGQVQSLYIVAEGPGGMYLVDQHAAHERVLYEKVQSELQEQATQVQGLLEPVVIELSASQEESLEAGLERWSRYGFELERFGQRTYLLRALPASLRDADPEEAFFAILEDVSGGVNAAEWEEEMARSLSCHGAVRAGKVLQQEEMESLLAQLEACERPNTCPHGRPTMVHLSAAHLQREFGRR
ncbi:MAG: DNA mismatch repair endonuclease MutL [Chloroflexota bacterium]|nr:DNA mismatch repair endonuclease MutL [Chloroflexota bacterium]MDE2941876.1 DNA mismatch repair endonuclease MutL [Chloroflexota bacterium]MDE3268347.1 DNA mismatch repair endonuclease MutL [Chloroflexota bacterium]